MDWQRTLGRALGVLILAGMAWIIVVATIAVVAWATITMIEFVDSLR